MTYQSPSSQSPSSHLPFSAQPTGKQLLSATWGLLKQDRALLWLPGVAAVTGLIAAVILFIPGFAIGWAAGGGQESWGGWVGGIAAAYAASVVGIYFQAALVIGAFERADGGSPTVGGVLRQAWARKGHILAWALLATTVGAAVRALERRFGAIGAILGFLGGVAWAAATFLAIPVLVAENLGPIAAVKRSVQVLRDTWGTSVRSTMRVGLIAFLFFLPGVLLIAVGIVVAGSSDAVGVRGVGIVLIVVGAAAFLVVAMVFNAVSTYARALIYRFAVGRPVPGIDAQLFSGVFRAKGRRSFA
jgi:hypothetical protein